MSRPALLALALFGSAFASAAARADPCTAPLPAEAGVRFSGEVRYVGDGDSLCIGATSDPADWLEVRLADFDAPELHEMGGQRAKQALARIALKRLATCVTERRRSGRVVVYDRVIARCEIHRVSIGALLRRAGQTEGGR